MDRRLAERRRRVAEDRARSNLGRLLRLLIVLALVAAGVWFVQSPFMSVGQIEIQGADRVDVTAVLADHGIVEGRPLLMIDVDAAQAALRQDPWVAEASVARDWPTSVVVEIEERTPAAGIRLAAGWWLAAADGTLLEQTPERPEGLPLAGFESLDAETAASDLEVRGAVEFLAALPDPHRDGAVITTGGEGLEATVSGFEVRVGRPFDAAEKAAVTAAMIDAGLEEGSIVTVVAPANPAVLPPGADVDTTEEESEESPEPGEGE